MIEINEFRRNQSQFPREELARYSGQYVAWSPDGTRILAASSDPAEVDVMLVAAGYDPGEILVSMVLNPEEVSWNGWSVPEHPAQPMIVRYTPCPVRSGVPGLAGATIVPRAILPVRFIGPSGYRLRDGLVDTGSDETILDPTIAPSIGVDLSHAVERDIYLVGRGPIRCRYTRLTLRITDGVAETYEWKAMVGFAPFRLLRSLLGFAGFMQYFDAHFRGALEEVVLFPNAAFCGRII